jgi:hypothetical protein
VGDTDDTPLDYLQTEIEKRVAADVGSRTRRSTINSVEQLRFSSARALSSGWCRSDILTLGQPLSVHLSEEKARGSTAQGPVGSEMNGLQIAAGCAADITAVVPTALRIAYIEVGDNDCGPMIAGKELIEFEPISECQAKGLLKARLDPIVKDVDTIDEALPKCSLPERYGTLYNPGENAGDFCRARHVYLSTLRPESRSRTCRWR